MMNTIRMAAAIAVIVGSGLVHGAWTNRWGVPPALKELAGRIESLPETIGPWTMTSSSGLNAREVAMTGAVGHVSRQYVNSASGQRVVILVLAGLPGNISTHTPDACYPGQGYVLGAPEKYSRRYGDPERVAEFQTAQAVRGGTDPSSLRIFWSWRGSKGWSAPDDARWSFAAEPMLTKLYVVRETGGAKVDPKDDPANSFMTALLPILDQAVNGQTEPSKVASR